MDKVKEIFAGEITVADVAETGGFAIATTDANTQLVVKDVNVYTEIDPSPKLFVDTFEVADLSTNVTGSEIVDVNSSLIYQAYPTAPSLTADVTKGIFDRTATPRLIEITENFINGSLRNTSFSSPVTITTEPNNYTTLQVDNIAFATNGDFFYFVNNGSNSQALYKRAGGVNGTETAIFSAANTWCVFDGIETYYYALSGESTLNKYNINTGVETTASLGVTLSGSARPNARMINDGNILVYRGSTDGSTSISIINPVTNQLTQITGLTSQSFSGVNYSFSAFYNSVTDRYTIYRRSGTSLRKSVLNGVLTVGSAYSGGVTNTSLTLPTPFGSLANHHYNSYIVNDDVNYSEAIHEQVGATDLETFNTLTSTTTTAPLLPFETYSGTFDIVTINNVSPSLFTDTAKIRVTGVETTL
jgi:hypothetical protein